MPIHFFNQTNPDYSTLQLCNLFCSGLLAIDYMINPEASASETGFAMATYMCSFMALSEKTSDTTEAVGISINIARLGTMFTGLTRGVSAWGWEANLIDAVGRLATIYEVFTESPRFNPSSSVIEYDESDAIAAEFDDASEYDEEIRSNTYSS